MMALADSNQHFQIVAPMGSQRVTKSIVGAMSFLGSSYSEASNLMSLDRGPHGGHMVTEGLQTVVRSHETYQLTKDGVKATSKQMFALNLEELANNPLHVTSPPYLKVVAIWDGTPIESGKANNLLGDNGLLLMRESSIDIPVVEANNDSLGYYGAILLNPEDRFFFQITASLCFV